MCNPEQVYLKDIADIERCESGIVYPKGTCYIQVSACSKDSAEKWHITQEASELPGKHAVVIPKVAINPDYLLEILEHSVEEFFCRYIGSNINIQIELFKYYKVSFHKALKDQQEVIDMLKPLKEDIKKTEREIAVFQQFKEYFLKNMFVNLNL